MGQTVMHSVLVNIDDLTPEQAVRFWHHVEISRRVFESSVHSMIKGVRKYGPEPDDYLGHPPSQAQFWLPHIFSEAVDAANHTGLFADALGVELKVGNNA